MSDKYILTKYILEQTLDASKTISLRFEDIKSVEDFTDTPEGKMKLDSICMLLIAIGDSLKKVDKLTDKKLLSKYDQIDWVGAKGTRDIIAHHYFDVDAQQVFIICQKHIPLLSTTIKEMLKEFKV